MKFHISSVESLIALEPSIRSYAFSTITALNVSDVTLFCKPFTRASCH